MAAERMEQLPWPPIPTFKSGGYSATPRPEHGVITWNINTTCNYRCSYCTQRFLENRTRWANDTENFLKGFSRLPGSWEVKLSGGEPFLHPTLFEIVSGLREMGHLISVVTNFSASTTKLKSFLEAADNSLRIFSASLHLEYISTPQDLENFKEKACFIIDRLPLGASYNVTCVATKSNLHCLSSLAKWFANFGICFKVQPEKQGREVIEYNDEEKIELIRLGGHNQSGKIAWSFKNRPCWAGALSFTLDDLGNAWRCYPARRFQAQYLGNFLDENFQLADGPSPCLYDYCNCSVPIERKMMPVDIKEDEKNEI